MKLIIALMISFLTLTTLLTDLERANPSAAGGTPEAGVQGPSSPALGLGLLQPVILALNQR